MKYIVNILLMLISFSLISQPRDSVPSTINHLDSSMEYDKKADEKDNEPLRSKTKIPTKKPPLTESKKRTPLKQKKPKKIEPESKSSTKEEEKEVIELSKQQILVLNINIDLNSEISPTVTDSLEIITNFVKNSIQYQLYVTGDKEENLYKKKITKEGNKTTENRSWKNYARMGADKIAKLYKIPTERIKYKGIESNTPTRTVNIQVIKYIPESH